MAMSGAALTMIFTLVRMVYYPFWALSAPAADLRHSWGGPTPAAGAPIVAGVVTSGTTPLSVDAANLIGVDHEVTDQCIAICLSPRLYVSTSSANTRASVEPMLRIV